MSRSLLSMCYVGCDLERWLVWDSDRLFVVEWDYEPRSPWDFLPGRLMARRPHPDLISMLVDELEADPILMVWEALVSDPKP